MNRSRIHVQATTTRDVANLIALGWSFARWCDALVEGYTVTANPVAALRTRLGRLQRNDLVIAELPSDPLLAADMVGVLQHAGQRALLLPPLHGPGDRLWGGWTVDAMASPAATTEAAVCAVIVEQHLRGRTRPSGHRGDPIANHAIAAVFNGALPTWPRDQAEIPRWRQVDRLVLGTIGPEGFATRHARRSPAMPMGWIVIPQRRAGRMSEALDSGSITVANGVPLPRDADAGGARLRAYVDVHAVRFVLPGTDTQDRTGLTFDLRAASLLDPGLHQSWEMLRDLLMMPHLRSDLLAASGPVQWHNMLMLDDDALVGAGAPSAAAYTSQEEP